MRGTVLALGIWAGGSALAWAESLEDAVAMAYANNPTLAEARLAVRAAREDSAQARAGYRPRVDFSAEYGVRRLEVEERGFFGPSAREEDLSGRTLSLRGVNDLYTGGRRRAQAEIASSSLSGAQEGLRGVEQDTLVRTITAYANVLREQEIVRIREEFSAALSEDLRGVRRRLDVGDVTRTDVSQSQARLARAQAGEAVARADLLSARAVYEAIVGAPPATLAPLPPPPGIVLSLEEALAAAERFHPEVQQARQDEATSRAQIDIERARLEPQLGVIGSVNFVEDQSVEGDLSQSAALSARLSVPLFEGGFAQSRIRQSRINAQRAERRTEIRRRQILAEVIATWHGLDAAKRVLEAARVQLAADESALDGVRREQGIGLRSTLDVLNAQQELLDSQLAVVRAERDSYVRVFELLSAIGVLNLEAVGFERDTGR
jgi:outer membrane protein